MKQHKWHKEIKAWADGAEIESYAGKCDDIWDDAPNPNWNNDNLKYRIKPQPVEPQYLGVAVLTNGQVILVRDGQLIPLIKGQSVHKIIGKIPLIVDSNDEV